MNCGMNSERQHEQRDLRSEQSVKIWLAKCARRLRPVAWQDLRIAGHIGGVERALAENGAKMVRQAEGDDKSVGDEARAEHGGEHHVADRIPSRATEVSASRQRKGFYTFRRPPGAGCEKVWAVFRTNPVLKIWNRCESRENHDLFIWPPSQKAGWSRRSSYARLTRVSRHEDRLVRHAPGCADRVRA